MCTFAGIGLIESVYSCYNLTDEVCVKVTSFSSKVQDASEVHINPWYAYYVSTVNTYICLRHDYFDSLVVKSPFHWTAHLKAISSEFMVKYMYIHTVYSV